MDMKECIETRRSIRSFTPQRPGEAQLRELIRMASYAPSWKNTQTVRWRIVTEPALLHALANGPAMSYPGNRDVIEGCPVLLVETCISGRSGYERDGSFSTSKGDRWEMFDAGAAAQTLCLAARDMGLGTVIMGAVDTEGVARLIGLEEGRSVSCLIALGYPDRQPPMPKRKTVDELLD